MANRLEILNKATNKEAWEKYLKNQKGMQLKPSSITTFKLHASL